MLITTPDRFATWFTSAVPGAPRRITAEDVRLMTECGLVGRYQYYGQGDLQTVIGILRYEQLREKRSKSPAEETAIEPPTCKGCGQLLHPQPKGKQGRPKAYCPRCESSRAKERYRKWRAKRKVKQKRLTGMSPMYNMYVESDRKEVKKCPA